MSPTDFYSSTPRLRSGLFPCRLPSGILKIPPLRLVLLLTVSTSTSFLPLVPIFFRSSRQLNWKLDPPLSALLSCFFREKVHAPPRFFFPSYDIPNLSIFLASALPWLFVTILQGLLLFYSHARSGFSLSFRQSNPFIFLKAVDTPASGFEENHPPPKKFSPPFFFCRSPVHRRSLF